MRSVVVKSENRNSPRSADGRGLKSVLALPSARLRLARIATATDSACRTSNQITRSSPSVSSRCVSMMSRSAPPSTVIGFAAEISYGVSSTSAKRLSSGIFTSALGIRRLWYPMTPKTTDLCPVSGEPAVEGITVVQGGSAGKRKAPASINPGSAGKTPGRPPDSWQTRQQVRRSGSGALSCI